MIVNARITSTHLGPEGHGIFSFMLQIEAGWSQGFGGYPLQNPGCGALLDRILYVCGVATWEDLPGTLIRVEDKNSQVEAIGHILEDRWLRRDEIPKILRPGVSS